MIKINLKMLVFVVIASAALAGCSVHNREYHRRPPRHDRDHHDDDNRRHDDHYYRNY